MRRRTLVAALLPLVLLGACREGAQPAPTAAPTSPATVAPTTEDDAQSPLVAVIVAPQQGQADVLERVRERTDRGDEVRWSIATATTSAVLPELVGRAVDEGASLVCVVGAGRVAAVEAIAAQVPGQRFCVGPAPLPDEPAANVLYVDVRVEETAYLAGALAALVAGPRPAGIITDRNAYLAARQQQAFEQGLADVGGPAAVNATGPVRDAEAARAAATAQFAGDVSVILSDASAADADVVEVAADVADDRVVPTEAATGEEATPPPVATPTGVIAGPSLLDEDEELADVVLAIVRFRPELVLLPAVERLLEGWEGGGISVGLVEGAVAFDLAGTPLATPHVDAINVIRGEIAAGDRRVLP